MRQARTQRVPPPVLWADVADLYKTYNRPVFGYIYHKLGKFGTSQELVEDLTAEVFLKAIEAMCAGRGPTSSVRGWIYRIAHNLVIDEYRHRSRRGLSVDFDALAEMAQDGMTPHEQVMSAIGCELIGRCIDRLKDEQAQAVTLVSEGYASQELAAILHINDSAAKARLHRGRGALRARLAGFLSEKVRGGPSGSGSR